MNVFTTLKAGSAICCAGLSYFFGGLDNLLIFLIALTGIDIVTGMIKAVYNKKLNSDISLKGLCRKAGIYFVIAICHLIDLTFGYNILRDGAVGFYSVMELISITENWGAMDLPLPNKLKSVLEQLQQETE